MFEQEPSHGDKIKLVCMHGFIASYFNQAIVERDYAVIKEYVGWGHPNWSLAMFSDESYFSVTSSSGYQLLWRERGTRYAEKFVRKRDRYGPDVMVWAGIMYNGRTPRLIFECKEALHQTGIAERIFWIMFVFLGLL
ncbi:hypothetical protein TNCV_2996451 [Trichonephila clavipes]|nr:hypothetical protein TNCV_2996451 [Trichonephila clavipes]